MDVKEEIKSTIKECADGIRKSQHIFLSTKNRDDIIDIGGQVAELLNLVVKYINGKIINGELVSTDSIQNLKNETTLFKEYCINYINGLLNSNEYIINKYDRYVRVAFDIWLDEVNKTFFC